MGVCNICGQLHYTSECEFRPKEPEPVDPIASKLMELLGLLKSKNYLNLFIGYYLSGKMQVGFRDYKGNELWCKSNPNTEELLDEAIETIKDL